MGGGGRYYQTPLGSVGRARYSNGDGACFQRSHDAATGPVYAAYTSQALEATNVEGTIQTADALRMGQLPEESVIHAIFDALLNAEKPLLVCGPDIRKLPG